MEKDYSLNPSICICENSKYLKSVGDTSVTKWDKIVIVMKNITTNVTTTALINCHSKKVRYCYILHTVLLMIILLLMTVIW